MTTDWNKILKKYKEYIKTKNKLKTNIENKRLAQMGLEENLSTLFSPLLNKENTQQIAQQKAPLQRENPPQIEPPEEEQSADHIIIKSMDDIKHYFSNSDPQLPPSIKPTIDEEGLVINKYRLRFSDSLPKFKIDQKKGIFILTKGLIDLLNGKDISESSDNDLIVYAKILREIKRSGPPTNRQKEVDHEIKYRYDLVNTSILERIDELDEDSLIQEIDDEMSKEGEGLQRITFLSDNPQELLNRLTIITEAMKQGHQSNYNEIHAILKRLLEKGIIDKSDYKIVIKKWPTNCS